MRRACSRHPGDQTSPSVSCNPTDSTTYTGTIGLPLPSTEIALLDDDGREVEPGTPGEIAVRGPQVMAGYWQRPDETARVMTANGYLRTGDIGTVDERGYFRIVDRKKDMILVSGFNVYPNEVEDVLATHPAILECAVVGAPSEETGEMVVAHVVLKDPSVSLDDLRAHARAQLTGYKVPRRVVLHDTLPKTNVGKVLRRMLRDETPPGAASPTAGASRKIRVRRLFPCRPELICGMAAGGLRRGGDGD